MKIALLWPDYWPYIRRGTERMVHDIAHFLAGRGDEVHIIASKPGPGVVRKDGAVTIFLLPQKQLPLLMRHRAVPRFDAHGLQVAPLLLRERYDLVHAFIYTYAPSVRLARALYGTPYIYHVVTIPPSWRRPLDGWMLQRALGGASAVRVFSAWCAEHLRRNYGVEASIVPPAVDAEHFRPSASRDPVRTRLVFAGDLSEERKGAHLLVSAFNEIHRRHPETQLVLAGPTGFDIIGVHRRLLSRLRPWAVNAVEFAGPGALAALPATYSSAALTVLPAWDEPFGMVLTESLACGTPVVGARSGAIPEIISDRSIGEMFDVDDDERDTIANLVEAVERALPLARDPATPERTRRHAQKWTWRTLGPRFEEMQRGALDRSRERRSKAA